MGVRAARHRRHAVVGQPADPKSASNQTGAEALMDFYYRPEIAAQVAAYVNYVCPGPGARRRCRRSTRRWPRASGSSRPTRSSTAPRSSGHSPRKNRSLRRGLRAVIQG